MDDRHSQHSIIFVAILVCVVDLKQNQASVFATFYSLVVLTTRSDVYTSSSGDFRADRRTLYPLRIHAG